jgi:hypothetical protein
MKRLIVLGLLLGLTLVGSAAAQSEGRWIPGTNYMISEEDAISFLEERFDYGYCRGIKRYGHQGEYPYEEFVVFDCSVEMSDGSFCSGVRMKSVKGSRRGYFKLTAMPFGVQKGKMSCS